MPSSPTLYLVCGKIAAGKSTLCKKLASKKQTVLLSEDVWLSHLFGPEMTTVKDYVTYSRRLAQVLGPHVVALLQAGVSVVLDFPANTLDQRRWMQTIYEKAGTGHELHYLDVPDELCKERLRLRNESGTHEFTPSEEEFDHITRFFVPPTKEEGFNLILHS
ncbi:MAG: ATP-binding protein [Proteobacteria bacterium]|nr:ATP-binding protein [Pseudomonadota bacterium]